MSKTENPPYVAASDFLQQGDIFRQEVVMPIASSEKRIFRTKDGRHGSVVFSQDVDGIVFKQETLEEVIKSQPPDKLRNPPFSMTWDGHPELVVAQANLATYFILATQSCDVAGDKPQLPIAIILSILPLKHICQQSPISMGKDMLPVELFLGRNGVDISSLAACDEFTYPAKIRDILARWNPSSSLEKAKSRIINYLNDGLAKSGWMHFLPADNNLGIPEAYVDFSAAYSVPTSRLTQLKSQRKGRIGDPYRDQFAQAFGLRISRIALPTPLRPPQISTAVRVSEV